jgi:hypothetical protein
VAAADSKVEAAKLFSLARSTLYVVAPAKFTQARQPPPSR